MPARITTVLALLAAGSDALSVVSSYKSYKSRRHLLSSLTFGAAAAVLAPNAAFASGVSPEEAAINAEKYTRASSARRRTWPIARRATTRCSIPRGPHEGGARGHGQARRKAVHAQNQLSDAVREHGKGSHVAPIGRPVAHIVFDRKPPTPPPPSAAVCCHRASRTAATPHETRCFRMRPAGTAARVFAGHERARSEGLTRRWQRELGRG